MNSTDKLTPRQARFVDEYLVDLNGTKAAIRAGYSEKGADVQASQLLGNPKVVAALKEAMDKRSERTQVTQDYVVQKIKSTIERCEGLTAVRTKEGALVKTEAEDGETAVMCEFDPMAVLKGAELLGRHLKMFTDKVEIHDRSLAERTTEELQFKLKHGRWPDKSEQGKKTTIQ